VRIAALRHRRTRQSQNRTNAKDRHDCLVRVSHFESPSFLQVVLSFRRLHVVAAVTEQDSDEPPRLAEVGEFFVLVGGKP
jgi:hypothetical protein